MHNFFCFSGTANLVVLAMYLFGLSAICGGTDLPAPIKHSADDTMLMFVGENLEVLTIASRREESAWQAPAIAQVLTRSEFREKGADTLSKALEDLPGFYMAQKEWGTQPFLRGIPDSILFLYDTIPLTSDISKSYHPMDRELPLFGVKRIEIIRGPGSVLWGPDAFAGIVNVVPMTGKDLDGIESGILYGEPGFKKGAYTNIGHDSGNWNSFMSLSGHNEESYDAEYNVVRFWGNGSTPVGLENRYGSDKPNNSYFAEASGRFAFEDWLIMSGRISNNRRSYVLGSQENLSWCETRDNILGIFKIEAKKDLDVFSVLRLTGSFTYMDFENEIIDRTIDQQENSAYGEVIYDRSLFSGSGLITTGISYREKRIENAPIWEGYFPDYLKRENLFLLPLLTEKDYSASLWSVFSQYTHRFDTVDTWIGIRQDNHDTYKDRISYNAGVSWAPSSHWMTKLLYGTAYRTPFDRQLREDENPELENIESINVQITWEPVNYLSFTGTGFWNRIRDHVMEDPYAGLSLPNDQTLIGAELAGNYSPLHWLDIEANLTLMDHSGPEERYRLLVDTYVDSDGNQQNVYEDVSYPYDSGPDALLNLMVTWKPLERLRSHLNLGYASSRSLIYPRGEHFESTPGRWLLNFSTTVNDLLSEGLDMEISIRNISDRHYETPGTYKTIDGIPISAQVIFRKRW